MAIPLYIFLFIYIGTVIFYLLASFVTLYHIFRFGFWDSSTKFMVALHFTITSMIIVITGLVLIKVDWSEEVQLFNDVELILTLNHG